MCVKVLISLKGIIFVDLFLMTPCWVSKQDDTICLWGSVNGQSRKWDPDEKIISIPSCLLSSLTTSPSAICNIEAIARHQHLGIRLSGIQNCDK